MKKIYIVTAHTGYNYGTYLQAYAMKKFIRNFSDIVEIVWQKSFGPNGRDFRINKMISLCVRSLLNLKNAHFIKQGYVNNFNAVPDEKTKQLFDLFSNNYLQIKEFSYKELKKKAVDKETIAVICGSDQIWNAASLYPDPLYYLQFVPSAKRIAYAPSFGRGEVPAYNKRKIKKYLNSIPTISVREDAGIDIVEKLIGNKVPVVPDPTLVVDWSDWIASKKENYILVYFLDCPTVEIIEEIKVIQKMTDCKIKILLHMFEQYKSLENIEIVEAGPKEFVEEISKAKFVCTDSYHASIFSIITQTPFYTYERNYGNVSNQGCRLETLLKHYKLEGRYRTVHESSSPIILECNMGHVNKIREIDTTCAHEYIQWALNRIKKGE